MQIDTAAKISVYFPSVHFLNAMPCGLFLSYSLVSLGVLKVPPLCLLSLNGLKQRLEIPRTKALMPLPLNDLKE